MYSDEKEDGSSDQGDDSGEETLNPSLSDLLLIHPHFAAAAATTFTVPAPNAALDYSSDEGDDSGEEDSHNPPHTTVAAPAYASDDDDNEREESGENDLETEKEQPPVPHAGNENSVPESAGKDAATPWKKTTGEGEAAVKLYQRIWSDEDQLILPKGMVDYMDAQGGNDPMANIEGFWSFIRKKLSFPVMLVQLMGKIRWVKEKYRNNQKKNSAFTKAYDAKVFELSKKLWEESMAREGGKKRKRDELEVGPVVKRGANDEMMDVDRLECEDETVSLSMEHIRWSEEFARAKIKSLAESKRN